MVSISEAFDKLNQQLTLTPLFFIVPETERGLGLEEWLDNYHIITPELDYFASQNQTKNIFSFANQGASVNILKQPQFIELIKQQAVKQAISLQFFKHTSDSQLLSFTKGHGLGVKLINNPASLNRQIENKVKQYQSLQAAGLSTYLPTGAISNLTELNLVELQRQYGEFVIQFPFGHTGESTLLFNQEEYAASQTKLTDLQAAKPKLLCKVTKYLTGLPLTINACVYQNQTFVGGLSYQYTGIAGLTPLASATVGNDWGLVIDLLTTAQIEQIVKMSEQVGAWLAKEYNYLGLFGLDLIWDQASDSPKLIEINARQTLSVPMHSKLQIKTGMLPLALLHLAAFYKLELAVTAPEYNQANLTPIQAAQVFLRSTDPKRFRLPSYHAKSGVYRLVSDNAGRERVAAGKKDEVICLDNTDDRPIVWQHDFASILQFDQDGFGLTIKPAASEVGPNQEIARIQAHRKLAQLVGDKIQLLPFVKDTLMSIKHISQP